MNNDYWQTLSGMRSFVPLAGFVVGLIAACIYRRLSPAMLLVIIGFAGLCADFILGFLSLFLAFGMGSSNIGGLGLMVFVFILQVVGWVSLVTGLVLTWKDFANRARRNHP